MKRDLLVEAIDIIQNVPRWKINLDYIAACAIGHLGRNPEFSAKTGLKVSITKSPITRCWNTALTFYGCYTASYAQIGAKVFDISVFEASALFGMRRNDLTTSFWESDKRVWLKRAHRLLAKYDENAIANLAHQKRNVASEQRQQESQEVS